MMTDSESLRDGVRLVSGWALPGVLVLLLLVLGLAIARLAPPSPLPESAPQETASAGRIGAVLARLVGDGAPHPVGSPAQARTRERVAAELRRLGYEVREEQDLACRGAGICASVRNLVAELPGQNPGAAVLLAAHTDSVGAGPGVSDDLAGVAAALEVARILKAGPRLRNSVIFLFDEGEEGGLLGAQGFQESSPEAGRVKVMVNLEARGTSGPSLMFETGRDNAWLIPLFAASVPHPRTSSVFSTLYSYLPNDTDFSVFKRRGLSGFNFAYIGGPAHYHTPLDNLANTSPASLQHHGENALATVRALANADIEHPRSGQAVFFDFLGARTFGWPAPWGLFLALAALLLVAAPAVRLRALFTGGEVARGFLAWWTVFIVAAAAGFALTFLLHLVGGLSAPWPAHGLPVQAAFWLLALAVAVAAAGWFRRAGFLGLWIGGWLVWALLGLLTALLLPGASYLFIIPALAAGLAGLFLPGGNGARLAAVLVPALIAGALWFPLLILFYDGLGSGALWLVGALLSMMLTAVLPLGAAPGSGGGRRMLVAGTLVAVAAFAVAAAVLPAYSPDSPRRLNFTYHLDAGTGQARWLALTPPPLPPAVAHAVSFGQPAPPYPWDPQGNRAYAAPAPVQSLAAPDLAVVRDETAAGKRHLVLHLSSPRGAATAFVFVPKAAQLESAQVAGRQVEIPRDWPAPFRSFQVQGLPSGGVDLDLMLGTATPGEWYVADRSEGLPPAGAQLLQARPAWAVPGQNGDTTLVSRKVTL
ncbi:MAG TPA: M20/M25/M40 family metallo-hydrolase [Thermoanaerobaculia bacterium]|nr:M20/M25/M40 family metallo-hydrolase [Thermoanaerobaculia bacterium]